MRFRFLPLFNADRGAGDGAGDVLGDDVLPGDGEAAPVDEPNDSPADQPNDADRANAGLLDDLLDGDGDDILASGAEDFFAALDEIGESSVLSKKDDEADADADDEADDDQADDAGDDDQADDDAGDEADDEADDETPEQAADVAALMARVNDALGFDVETPEALIEAVQNEMHANDELLALFEREPQLLELTRLAMEGKSLVEALVELGVDAEDATNPDVVRARAKKEVLDQQRTGQLEAAKRAADEARDAFKTARKLTDPQMAAFQQKVALYVYGDPRTGQLPADFLDVMYRGLQYENDVQAAREAGRVKGKNEAVTEQRTRKQRKGDAVPYAKSGRAEPVQHTREASLEDLASQLAGSGGVLDSLFD